MEKYRRNLEFIWIWNFFPIFMRIFWSHTIFDENVRNFTALRINFLHHMQVYPIEFVWADLCYVYIHKFLTPSNSFSRHNLRALHWEIGIPSKLVSQPFQSARKYFGEYTLRFQQKQNGKQSLYI